MKREWHLGRGVAGADARSDQPRARRRAHSSEVDRMTVVEVLGRVDELADGTGGTADAVRGDGNWSISEIPAWRRVAVDGGAPRRKKGAPAHASLPGCPQQGRWPTPRGGFRRPQETSGRA